MIDYLYDISNQTSISTAHAPQATTTTSVAAHDDVIVLLSGHVAVIVILSALVIAGILFFVCGLLLKAEAHLAVERRTIHDELLADSLHIGMGECD